jgi:hypothetical protein
MEKLSKEDYEKYKILNYWSPFETSCLLLGIDPDTKGNNSPPSPVIDLHKIILDAISNNEESLRVAENNGQTVVCGIGAIYWAKQNDHPIPKELEIERKRQFIPIFTDMADRGMMHRKINWRCTHAGKPLH